MRATDSSRPAAVLAATLSAALVAGAMAAGLLATDGSSEQAAAPVPTEQTAPLAAAPPPEPAASARPAGPGPLVLAGRGRRPVWSFVVVAPDGAGDLGSATVEWTASGPALCPDGPVPLGAYGTDVAVTIDGPAAGSGRTVGSVSSAAGACDAAYGSWRGVEGALRGRSGTLGLRVDDRGVVRLTLRRGPAYRAE